MNTISIDKSEILDKQIPFTHDWVFYTIQGEGAYIGRPSIFVRTSYCNLRCAWKNTNGTVSLCDTPYSSFNPEKYNKTIRETIEEISKYSCCKNIVITGGEPLMHSSVGEFIMALKSLGYSIDVETNGTLLPPSEVLKSIDFLSISPKLRSSQYSQNSQNYLDSNPLKKIQSINIDVLAQLVQQKHQMKFVVHDQSDILEIELIIQNISKKNKIPYDENNIYLMPQATNSIQLQQNTEFVIEQCKERNWNYSDRLHLRLWGSKRAV